MPRLTKLDDVLFPVEEHPVFVSLAENGDERRRKGLLFVRPMCQARSIAACSGVT